MRKPSWLLTQTRRFTATADVRSRINSARLHTVCRSARCPNMGECFSAGVATFMILGDKCSRCCGFCAVTTSLERPDVDAEEPERVARTAAELGLSHVVVTSVTRDDLKDGGSDQFAKTIGWIRKLAPGVSVEVLTPDFKGDSSAIDHVTDAGPDVFNHNVETAPRLYSKVRPQADYSRSLELITRVKSRAPSILTKSGMMLGLGETMDETLEVMKDLKEAGCDILTIGQYLQPTLKNLPVKEYIKPEVFDKLSSTGEQIGFLKVFAGPLVRSSYHADAVFGPARARQGA